ncbi:ester cyclase [Halorubellus salinus]|uniref:ester cyclase n=1 Tax=Halorubellus salinus TaxID=755309 RepID=UPI001D07EEBA|nr:ester cyclase [Halorubellus salinus]
MPGESGRATTQAPHDLDPRVERGIEAFNDHDVERVLDAFADDGTFYDPLLDDPVSGRELREYTAEVFEAFPDLTISVRRVVAATDDDVALELRYVGTHEGSMDGIPATGRRATTETVAVLELGEDGIESWRDYFDQVAFREQLGLTFPAVLSLAPKLAVRKLKAVV